MFHALRDTKWAYRRAAQASNGPTVVGASVRVKDTRPCLAPRQPVHPAHVQALSLPPRSLRRVGSRLSTTDDYSVQRKRFSDDRVCLWTVAGGATSRLTRRLSFAAPAALFSHPP